VITLDRVADGELNEERDGNGERDCSEEYVDDNDTDGDDVVETEPLPVGDALTEAVDDFEERGVFVEMDDLVDVFVGSTDRVDDTDILGEAVPDEDLEDVVVLNKLIVGLGDLDADLVTDDVFVTMLDEVADTVVEVVEEGEREGVTDDEKEGEIVGELEVVTEAEADIEEEGVEEDERVEDTDEVGVDNGVFVPKLDADEEAELKELIEAIGEIDDEVEIVGLELADCVLDEVLDTEGDPELLIVAVPDPVALGEGEGTLAPAKRPLG
jgi:hypothetical protein